MAEDNMTRGIRNKLNNAGIKPFKYIKNTGKLFLASGKSFVNLTMPTLQSYYDTNKDILQETAKFFKSPTDQTNKVLNKAMGTEGFQALQKLAKAALDDLKSGDLYDPDRIRTGNDNGDSDDLLNSFGGFDFNFDDNGEWMDSLPDPSVEIDKKIAEKQDEKDDERTIAIIKTVGSATDAIVSTDNANSQANIRLMMRQHSQIMAANQNMIVAQNAIFTQLNNSVNSTLEVAREAHNQTLAEIQSIHSTLKDIKDIVTPKEATTNNYHEENDKPFGINGEFNIKNYGKGFIKHISDTFNLSMIGGGFSPSFMIDLLMSNPLQLVSDKILQTIIPKSLKKKMESTGKNISGLAPGLLQKLYSKGKTAFDFDATHESMIANMFGLSAPKSDKYLHFGAKDIGKQAMLTNRTVTAIETVIPLWLSRIDYHLAGGPAMIYNYERNKLERASNVIAENEHKAVDLVGNMRDTGWNILNKAEKYKFKTKNESEDFKNYMYQFLQSMGENNEFINPFMKEEDFKKLMPESMNKDFYYKLITAIFKNIPKSQLINSSFDIQNARAERDRSTFRLNKELRDNGLLGAWSILDPSLTKTIKDTAGTKRFGATTEDLNNIIKNHHNRIESEGQVAAKGARNIVNDIASMLRRGIITYTYIIGDKNTMDKSITARFSHANDESIKQQNLYSEQSLIAAHKIEDKEYEKNRYRDSVNKEINSTQNKNPRDYYITEKTSDEMINRIMDDIVQTYSGEKRERKHSNDPEEERRLRELDAADMRRKSIVNKAKSFITGKAIDTSANSKFNKFYDTINKPFSLAESGLEAVDNLIFRLLYGKDALDKVNKASGNGNEKEHTIVKTVTETVTAQLADAKDWFKDEVGNPIKNFLLDKDSGLLPRIKKVLSNTFKPFKDNVTGFAKNKYNKVKGKIIGKKDENGFYAGGEFSDKINSFKNVNGEVENKFSNAIDQLLYGSAAKEKRKGVKKYYEYKYDESSGAAVKHVKNTKYSGVIGRLRQGFDGIQNFLFGGNQYADTNSRKSFNIVKNEINDAAPDMVVGGLKGAAITTGMGLLTGLWLPGGPLFGGIVGSALGFMKSSEKFKHFIFGDKMDVNDKNGNKIGETRKGGLISNEVYEGMKKYAPKVGKGAMIGATLGGIGLLPFGIGPIIGGIFGSMGGMVSASDEFKKMIFGDSVDPESGLISKNFRDKVKGQIKKVAPSALGGAVLGSSAWGLISNIGIIPGLSLIPGGPIFGLLGAMAGGYNADSIHKFFFGTEVDEEEEELDKEGKPTGKKIHRKKREGGIFNSVFNGLRDKAIAPFARKIDSMGKSIHKWFESDVMSPLKNSMKPFKEQIKKSKNYVKNTILDGINAMFERNIGKPAGEFFKEKILKPLESVTNKIFSAIGKMLGAIISAPFKAFEYIVTGGRNRDDNDLTTEDDKINTKRDKEATWREKTDAKWKKRNDKRRDRRYARAAKRRAKSGAYFQSIGERVATWKAEQEFDHNQRIHDKNNKYNTSSYREGFYKDQDQFDENGEYPNEYVIGGKSKKKSFFDNIKEDITNRKNKRVIEKTARDKRRSEIEEAIKLREDKRRKEREDARDTRDKKRNEEKDKRDKEKKARQEERGGAGRKRTNNDYLKQISRGIKNIFGEIKDQVSGVGWNTAYIRALLEKQFGKTLSDGELPEEMEGSKKHIRKRHGFFGKIKDKVTDTLWGIHDAVSDKFGKVKNGAKGVWDKITYPFYLLSQAASGAASALSTFGHGVLAFLKAAGPIVKNVLTGFSELFKAAATTFANGIKTFSGVIKDTVLGLSSMVRGAFEFIVDAAPVLGHYIGKGLGTAKRGLWKGIKFAGSHIFNFTKGVGKKIKKGVGRIGRGIRNKFRKNKGIEFDENGNVRNIGVLRIEGGYLDRINDDIGIKIGPKTNRIPVPWVTVMRGQALSKLTNHAIPVYIMGVDNDVVMKVTGSNVNNTDTDEFVNENGKRTRIIRNSVDKNAKIHPRRRKINVDNNAISGTDKINNTKSNTTNSIKKQFSTWKRTYFGIDAKAEQDKANAANVYDEAIKNAKDMDDVNAIKDAAQLNASTSTIVTGTAEKKENGLLDLLLSLFGEGGIGKKIAAGAGALLGATALGKALTSAKAGITRGIKGFGAGGILGTIGTVKAAMDGDYGHATSFGLRTVSGQIKKHSVGTTKLLEKTGLLNKIKAAGLHMEGNIAENRARKVFADTTGIVGNATKDNTLKSKVTGTIVNLAKKVMNNKLVQKIVPAKFRKGLSGAIETFRSKLAKNMATCTADVVKGFAKKLNVVVTVATAAYDFVSGFNEAASILKIDASNVTTGMKVSSGAAKCLSNLAFGLVPIDWLSTSIYKLFANDDKDQALDEAQTAFKTSAAEAGMDVDQYNDQQNQTVGEKIGSFFGKIGNAIKNGVSAAGNGIKSVAGKAWNGIKNFFSGWTNGNSSANEGNGKGIGWGTGPNMKAFNQTDGKWNLSDKNMSKVGCGPTAAAMVASAYGDKNANPAEANNLSYGMGMRDGDGGTNPDFFNQYAQNHSFGMSEGPISKTLMSNNLSRGKPVVLMGKGGAFGNNTHYLVANKSTGSRVTYVDPLSGSSKSRDMNDILSHTQNTIYSFGKGPNIKKNRNSMYRWGKGVGNVTISSPMDVYNLYSWPTSGRGQYKYDRGFEIHQGEDIHLNGLRDVLAFTDGTVIAARHPCANNSGSIKNHTKILRGNIVVIKDGKGYFQWYQHLNDVYVKDGQTVKCGQPIGSYGNTGFSSGPHLHIEINKPSSGTVSYNGERIAGGTYKDNVKPSDYIKNYGNSDVYTGGDVTPGTNGWSLLQNVTNRSGAAVGEKFDYLSNIATVFTNIGTKYDNILTAATTGQMPDDGTDSTNSTGSYNTNTSDIKGNDNAQKIWNYFKGQGLSDAATAGIMGNWRRESGLTSKIVQGGFGFNTNTYTNNADNNSRWQEAGTKKEGYVGYGLAQWTPLSRKNNLLNMARSRGTSIGDLGTQLDFAMEELQGKYTNNQYSDTFNRTKNATTPEQAADEFLSGYEMGKNFVKTHPTHSATIKGRKFASEIYNAFHNNSDNGKGPGLSGNFDNIINKFMPNKNTQSPKIEVNDYGKGNILNNAGILGSTITKINNALQRVQEDSKSESTVSTITKAITKSIGSSTNSDKILQTIAGTLATMVDLLSSIKDNTTTVKNNSTTNINKANRSIMPKAYANNYTPDNNSDVGMSIIDKLTLK